MRCPLTDGNTILRLLVSRGHSHMESGVRKVNEITVIMRQLAKNTMTDVPAINLWISGVGSYSACCGGGCKNTPWLSV